MSNYNEPMHLRPETKTVTITNTGISMAWFSAEPSLEQRLEEVAEKSEDLIDRVLEGKNSIGDMIDYHAALVDNQNFEKTIIALHKAVNDEDPGECLRAASILFKNQMTDLQLFVALESGVDINQ